MKRVLIVSPHFPPTNAPDQQRVRTSLPYFRENGWEAEVLAVDAGSVAAPKDPLQLETLPADVPVHRVSALPLRVTRWVGLGNIGYRGWFQLRTGGAALLRSRPFDLVYFSTTQFIATGLGRVWRDAFGVPFVIDIQDPWRTDYYERAGAPAPPGGWKYRFARRQAARLEEKSWQPGAGFISVSQNYLDQLAARYRWFAGRPAAVIPFGAPEADFILAGSRSDVLPAFQRDPALVHVVSVGAVGPIMGEALGSLFRSVQVLRRENPPLAARLRFHFIGTSYASGDQARPSVVPIAAQMGVGYLVDEKVPRVGYFTALKTLLAADAIVIPGSNDPGYRPSRLAACALAGKPVLALSPVGSAFARHAREFNFVLAPAQPNATASPEALAFLRALATGSSLPATILSPDHTARATTRRQCELLQQALIHSSPGSLNPLASH